MRLLTYLRDASPYLLLKSKGGRFPLLCFFLLTITSLEARTIPAGLIMHHYETSEKSARMLREEGINVWEIDIWEPNNWGEVDGKITSLLRGNPKAMILLRVALPIYPDDEEHAPYISTSEDGTRWTQMLGQAKWFTVGEISEKLAPAGRWTNVIFDISATDRKGVCRLWDLVIWHNETKIPIGAKLRFYIDDIEFISSKNEQEKLLVGDMEETKGICDQERYPQEPRLSEEIVHSGRKSLLWEHIQDGKHDGLIYKGIEPAVDLSRYDKLSLWIYPETNVPYRIEVRICGGLKRMGYPSLASDKWLDDCKNVLAQLIRHLDKMSYRHNILGLTLAGGLTAEWAWAGASADCGVDYSPSARKSWQNFLRNRYKTMGNLKRKWSGESRKYSSFSEINIPGKSVRLAKPELGDFYSPSKHRELLDYNEFIASTVAKDIVALAKFVKEESKGSLLIGVLFGYLGGYGDMLGKQAQQVGHAMPEGVLNSPYVDYIAAPLMYWDREIGGPSLWWLPVDSIKAHNKIPINEADSPSHLTKGEPRLQPQNLWETIQVLRRDAGATIVKGMREWHFFGNLGGEMMLEKEPNLIKEIGMLNRLLSNSLPTCNSSESQVAVIVDRKSLLCLHPHSYLPGFIYYQLPELARMGAPI